MDSEVERRIRERVERFIRAGGDVSELESILVLMEDRLAHPELYGRSGDMVGGEGGASLIGGANKLRSRMYEKDAEGKYRKTEFEDGGIVGEDVGHG